jgi:hypothetical protein
MRTISRAALLTAGMALSISAQAQNSADELIARLDQYLSAYELKLSELIADEMLVQEINGTTRLDSPEELSPRNTRQRRRLASEVAFIALPNDAGWLGFRSVKTVDNRKVDAPDQSLKAALQIGSYDAARSLLNDSAAQNLGLPRTTNLPNLPLEFLHLRNRKRLVAQLDAVERIRGVETTQVVFSERTTPSLIQSPFGTDMPSVIRAWIDRDGRLWRAEVKTFKGSSSLAASTMRVDFTEHKDLGLLVPAEMRETFPVEPPATGTGVARYSNFRRFQTSGRIITPPGAF